MKTSRNEHILLIEDDEALSRMMLRQLEDAGYQVTACFNGQSGIQAARESEPDLILLDILLPDIDGWIVCKELMQTTGIPIIVSIGSGAEEDVVRGLDLGAADYLIKPFSYKELLARVQTALHRAQPSAGIPSDDLDAPAGRGIAPQEIEYKPVSGHELIRRYKKAGERDFSGADLDKADLRGADLRGADFSGANLGNADLSRAVLSRADLIGTNLSGANLHWADLGRAKVTPEQLAQAASLRGATMPDGTAHD